VGEQNQSTQNPLDFAGTVVGLVYGKTLSSSITVEFAIGSLIASLVWLTRSSSQEETIISLIAAALAVLSLLRLMAVHARYGSDAIVTRTHRLLEFLFILSSYHLVTFIATVLPADLNSTFGIATLVILAALLWFITFIALELGYNAYRLLWGSLMYAVAAKLWKEHEEGNDSETSLPKLFSGLFQLITYLILKDGGIPDEDRPELNELREFIDNFRDSHTGKNHLTLRAVLATGLITALLFGVISLLTSVFTGSILLAAVILLSAWILRHIFQVLSLAFGTGTYNTIFQSGFRGHATLAAYVVILWLVFY
jgi:hypothetical protein